MSKVIDLIQNSPEWHDYRKTKIGASDAGTILGINPWKTPYKLWQEKLGLLEPEPMNDSMKLGQSLEKNARKEFEKKMGVKVEPKVLAHDNLNFMIASMDGISCDNKIAVEIKCPGERAFNNALRGVIPSYYQTQMQHQMHVCDLEEMFYFVYIEKYETPQSVCLPFFRDEKLIKKIIDYEKNFYDCLMEFEPPSLIEKDFINMENNREWKELCIQMKMIKNNMKFLENLEKETRTKLLNLSGNLNARGCGLQLSKVVKMGTVQYQQIPEIKNINLDSYRSKPSEYWKIQFSID